MLSRFQVRICSEWKRAHLELTRRHADQRWYMFQKMGPTPSARSGHAMASMGSRVFVLGGLGGESLNPAKPEDPTLIHVLDTSMSIHHLEFHISQFEFLQNTSNIRQLINLPPQGLRQSVASHLLVQFPHSNPLLRKDQL